MRILLVLSALLFSACASTPKINRSVASDSDASGLMWVEFSKPVKAFDSNVFARTEPVSDDEVPPKSIMLKPGRYIVVSVDAVDRGWPCPGGGGTSARFEVVVIQINGVNYWVKQATRRNGSYPTECPISG